MARQGGAIAGGGFGGAVLDTLVVKIDVDLSGFSRGIAQAIAEVRSLKGAIAAQVGGVSLSDAMNAALVAPVLVATARLGQMRNEVRALATEMRTIGAVSAGAAGAIAAAPVLDATPRRGADGGRVPTRISNGRMAPAFDVDNGMSESAALAAGAAIRTGGREDPQMRTERNLRRGVLGAASDLGSQARNAAGFGAGGVFSNWFARQGERTRGAFEERRNNSPGFDDAVDNLGGASRSVGNAGRRIAGSRIASMLGLVGLGALFGDLLKLAASLATVIGATLAGAFAALATPLGLVVAAITALVGLFVAANWDQFREFGEWFGERAKMLMGEAAGDIAEGFREVMSALGELWALIKQAFGVDDDSILHALQFFGEIALRVLNAVGEAVGGLLRILAELIRTATALFSGDWAGIWEHASRAVSQAVTAIKETFLSLFPELRQGWDDFFGWFEARARDAATLFGNLFRPRSGSTDGELGGDRGDGTVRGGAGDDIIRGMSFGGSSRRRPANANDNDNDQEEAQLERLGRLADDFGYRISGAFEEAVVGGRKFGDVIKSLIADLLLMVLRMAVIEPMARGIANALNGAFKNSEPSSGKSSGGNGWMSAIVSAIGSFFGGAHADGGMIPAGKWGLVGEKGPELILGGMHGKTIVPLSPAARGGGGMVIDARAYINAAGADPAAVARLQSALARRDAQLPSVIRATVGDMNQRGRGWAA